MEAYQNEKTISLWNDDGRRGLTLKNLQTGRCYSFVLKHRFVIGRKKECCDLQIAAEDRYMSRKHLRFTNEGGDVYVEDLHTKNGTRLNGKLVVSKTKIRQGDILKIGRSEYEVTL